MAALILTTLNEAEGILLLMTDILSQTRLPSEVLIVDAGSSDDTVDQIRSMSASFSQAGIILSVSVYEGCNIALGRNLAISKSSCSIIVVTDAGCRLENSWLERITDPIVEGECDFVGGFFRPVTHSRFQNILAKLTVANTPNENFLPSSRSVAFEKALWEKAEGYPEWLDWGEDTFFDNRCIQLARKYVVIPDAIVHWEVRRSFAEVSRQYYQYGYGDGFSARRTKSYIIHFTIQICFFALFLSGNVLISMFFLLVLHSGLVLMKGIRLNHFAIAIILSVCISSLRSVGYMRGIVRSKTSVAQVDK